MKPSQEQSESQSASATPPHEQDSTTTNATAEDTTAPGAPTPSAFKGWGLVISLVVIGLIMAGIVTLYQRGSANQAPQIPNVTGSYNGSLVSTADPMAPMSLTLTQQGKTVHGTLSLPTMLSANAAVQGEVGISSNAYGTVLFQATGTTSDGKDVTIVFDGQVGANVQSLFGTYTINNGPSSTWQVSRVNA